MASDEPGLGQKHVFEARRHIAALQRVVPGIAIEIRWCPAHEGVEGNEKADEWAKLTAGEPDTPGVEGWTYSERLEERATPLPRSLTNIKREIAEKKWVETRKWVGGRTSKKKYKMPKSQMPDGTVAGSAKRLASRFYQPKMGHCLTGEYLHWSKSRPTLRCWLCRCPKQTRDHLLKRCPRWKEEQKVLWQKVEEEKERGRERWKAHELFAGGGQCFQAILDFLSSTDIGKKVPPVVKDGDVGSEVSEGELRE